MVVDDRTLGGVLLGIDGFRLLAAGEAAGEVVLEIETTTTRTGCRGCGVVASPHGRRVSVVRDLPVSGRPCRLVWCKRIWRCHEPVCPVATWTEQHPAILPRAVLTERARAAICRQVGKLGRSVAEMAREYGVGWQAAMGAVVAFGRLLVEDPARLEGVARFGVDETAFLKANRHHHTSYATGMVDLGRSLLLDVVEGRTCRVVADWLAARPVGWVEQVTAVALDPYRGYHTALRAGVPAATVVVDRFHAVRLANTAVDEVRRRVQQTVHGHRGRKHDPLYRIRRLLVTGAERLTPRGFAKLEGGWAAGDPLNEVYAAWETKEALRTVYAAPSLDDARLALDDFYAQVKVADIPECSRLARTVRRWEPEILAFHTTGGLSNGRTEATNLLVKKIKRVGHGFRNFANYRLRLLLHCGVTWQDHPTTRIRARQPRSAA